MVRFYMKLDYYFAHIHAGFGPLRDYKRKHTYEEKLISMPVDCIYGAADNGTNQ